MLTIDYAAQYIPFRKWYVATSLEITQSPVSGFCYARNRVCDAKYIPIGKWRVACCNTASCCSSRDGLPTTPCPKYDIHKTIMASVTGYYTENRQCWIQLYLMLIMARCYTASLKATHQLNMTRIPLLLFIYTMSISADPSQIE